MEDEQVRKYGILMNMKRLDQGIYMFCPEYLISGDIVEVEGYEYFEDDMGSQYLFFNDSDLIQQELEQAVGYIVTEEQLLAKYPGSSLDEAKSEYFDDIREVSHIGFYLYNEDKIAVVEYRLNEMSCKLNAMSFDPDASYVQILEDTPDVEDSILSLDFKKENIVFSFEIIRKAINELDNIDSCKNQLIFLIDKLNKFADNIKLINGDDKELEDSNKYIHYLIRNVQIILDEKTIESIKEKFEAFYNKEIESVKKIYNAYDKYVQQTKELITANEDEYGYASIDEKEQVETKIDMTKIKAKDMKQYLDERIIGQDEAKKAVISAIIMNKLTDDPEDKTSCLLVGPTGSGKTLIAQTVAKYLDLPVEIIDTTQLTIPGYKGSDIEDSLTRLLIKANGNVKKAENGIVVFDEIDKKGYDDQCGVFGKGLLDTLLPFVQGSTYSVKYNNRCIDFNTANLTVFATGAFVNVAKAKKTNGLSGYNSNVIGFNSKLNGNNNEEDIVYPVLEPEDFVKYGNIPVELIGRFSTIVQLKGHTKESLKKILLNEYSTLLIQKKKLNKIGIDLVWTDAFLDKVVEKALTLKTGARSLKSVVEKCILEVRWVILENIDDYCGIILTDKTVDDNFECKLIDKNGDTHSLKSVIKKTQSTQKNSSKNKVLKKKKESID